METLLGTGAAARGVLVAFLFLVCLEGSALLDDDDELVLATGVAVEETTTGEGVVGEEHCLF